MHTSVCFLWPELSEKILGCWITSSSRWGRELPRGLIKHPYNAQDGPGLEQNQAGSWGWVVSLFYLLAPFSPPLPVAPGEGAQERSGHPFNPGVQECELFLAAHWAQSCPVHLGRACQQLASVCNACEVTALPSCF